MQCRLSNISVATKLDKEGKRVLVVHMPGGSRSRNRSDRRIMTPDDAKMVLELVKVRACVSHAANIAGGP